MEKNLVAAEEEERAIEWRTVATSLAGAPVATLGDNMLKAALILGT